MVWVGRVPANPLVPTPLPWARTPSIRPGCSELHPQIIAPKEKAAHFSSKQSEICWWGGTALRRRESTWPSFSGWTHHPAMGQHGKTLPAAPHPRACLSGNEPAGSATPRSLETIHRSFLRWLSGICPWDQQHCHNGAAPAQNLAQGSHSASSRRVQQPASSSLGTCIPRSQKSSAPTSSKDPDKNTTLPEPSHYTSTQAGRNIYFSAKCSHDNHIFI